MNIFLIFSKTRSFRAAELVRRFLKRTYGDAVRVTLSTDEVQNGRPLMEQVLAFPEECDFAVVCLTEENCYNPWIVGETTAVRYLQKPLFFLVVPPDAFARELWGNVPYGFLAIPADTDPFGQLAARLEAMGLCPAAAVSTEDDRAKLQEVADSVTLAPRQLRNLIDGIWGIHESESPLNAVVRNEVISRSVEALESLRPTHHNDVRRYRDEVERIVSGCMPASRVIALCGHKGLASCDVDRYFEQFYQLAHKSAELGMECPTLIRVFVVGRDGKLHAEVQKPYEQHRNRRPHVAGPIVTASNRSKLERDFPGLLDHLDHGYGFVAFLRHGRNQIVTHSGEGVSFYMSVSEDPLVLTSALSVWRSFLNASDASPSVKAIGGRVSICW